MRERATDATFYCAGGDASVRLDDLAHGARRDAVDARAATSDDDDDDDDDDGDGARAREAGTSEEEADGARSPTARADATRVDGGIDSLVLRDGVVDVSGRIAEKMLAGWTLTNDVCPVSSCAAPLVRNRAGRIVLRSPRDVRSKGRERDARDGGDGGDGGGGFDAQTTSGHGGGAERKESRRRAIARGRRNRPVVAQDASRPGRKTRAGSRRSAR